MEDLQRWHAASFVWSFATKWLNDVLKCFLKPFSILIFGLSERFEKVVIPVGEVIKSRKQTKNHSEMEILPNGDSIQSDEMCTGENHSQSNKHIQFIQWDQVMLSRLRMGQVPYEDLSFKIHADTLNPICEMNETTDYVLFRYATAFDWFLIFFGTLFAMVHGAGFPLLAIVFGNMSNVLLNPVGSNISTGIDTIINVTDVPNLKAGRHLLQAIVNQVDQQGNPVPQNPPVVNVASDTAQQQNVAPDIAQQPNAAANINQQPNIASDTAQQPNAAADTAQQPNVAADTAQQPNVAADTAQQPNAAADTAQQPNACRGIRLNNRMLLRIRPSNQMMQQTQLNNPILLQIQPNSRMLLQTLLNNQMLL
ncbi:Protein piccolo [Nymphon striatum]|nr:Protein piccolo [Nymphon striatum]